MFQVTLTFSTLDALKRALRDIPEVDAVASAPVPLGNAKAEKSAKAQAEAPASAPVAATPSPAKQPAAAPAPTPATNPLAGDEGYKILQAAVFSLAALDGGASAKAVNAQFGVPHMRQLPEDQRPDALAKVQAAIATLKASQGEVA